MQFEKLIERKKSTILGERRQRPRADNAYPVKPGRLRKTSKSKTFDTIYSSCLSGLMYMPTYPFDEKLRAAIDYMIHHPSHKYSRCKRLGVSGLLLLALIAFGARQSLAYVPWDKLMLGDDHGLTDMTGKELVPPIYASIHYLGHGLFLLKQRCPEREKRFDCEREKILLNNSFTKLETSVPPNATFERMLGLGKRAEEDEDLVIKQMPEDALLVFRGDENFGVCDSKGREILSADYLWIGNLRKGMVALRKYDDSLYSFNFETRELRRLSYQKVRRDCHLAFSEGLAAFATEPSEGKSMWGFLDTGGNIVIEPKYVFANPFRDGVACVRFPANGGPAHNELIDKSGKLASPPDLKVISTVGRYIEVRNSSGNCGVVNRKFEYVIQPKYKGISAQLATPQTVDDTAPPYLPSTDPIYYFAIRNEDGRPVILSPKGELVLLVPPEFATQEPPMFADGVFSFFRRGVPFAKATAMTLKGEIVPRPYSDLSDSKDVTFRQIAPGVLVKTIRCSEAHLERANGVTADIAADVSSLEYSIEGELERRFAAALKHKSDDEKLECKIRCVVLKPCEIKEVKTLRESGDRLFDNLAMNTILSLENSSFLKLLRSKKDEDLEIVATFRAYKNTCSAVTKITSRSPR